MPAPASNRRRAALVAALAAIAAAPCAGGAQGTVTITGQIVDVQNTPVPAAEVVVVGTTLAARADEMGWFTVDAVPPGEVNLTFRRLGFRPRDATLNGRGGDTLQVRVELLVAASSLEEVRVTGKRGEKDRGWLAQFEQRRAKGFGTFLTRADIEQRNPSRTSDVFRNLSGVAVVPSSGRNTVRMARTLTCAPDVYIDGQHARGFELDDMPPGDVAGIEIFHGPAETPAVFRRYYAGCGVIAVWTQPPGPRR